MKRFRISPWQKVNESNWLFLIWQSFPEASILFKMPIHNKKSSSKLLQFHWQFDHLSPLLNKFLKIVVTIDIVTCLLKLILKLTQPIFDILLPFQSLLQSPSFVSILSLESASSKVLLVSFLGLLDPALSPEHRLLEEVLISSLIWVVASSAFPLLMLGLRLVEADASGSMILTDFSSGTSCSWRNSLEGVLNMLVSWGWRK